MSKQSPVVSVLGHKVLDLSISLISLFSFILYVLFPHIAFASVVDKNKALSFDFSSDIKSYSFMVDPVSDNLKLAKGNKVQFRLPVETEEKKVNFKASAVITADYRTGATANTASNQKPADTEGMSFAEHISKDKYIDPEEEQMLLAGEGKIVSKRIVTVSAYSSTPDQTDSSPFITAAGTHVHDGIVATNILPFGTKIRIPALYGNKIFTVEDRMNTRFQNNVDVWFTNRQAAKTFGIKRAEIEIVRLP